MHSEAMEKQKLYLTADGSSSCLEVEVLWLYLQESHIYFSL